MEFNHTKNVKHRHIIFYCDMDGVLCNIEESLKHLVLADEKYAHLWVDDRESEDLCSSLDDFVKPTLRKQGFYRNLQPYPGSIDAIKWLSHQCLVFFLTSPIKKSQHCLQEKRDWIVEHFGESAERRLIISSDKSLLGGKKCYLLDDRVQKGVVKDPKWEWIKMVRSYNKNEHSHWSLDKLDQETLEKMWEQFCKWE